MTTYYAEQSFTVTNASTKSYVFTKSYRVQSTIKVYLRTPPGDFVETTEFTLSGTEGDLTVTLTGTAATNLAVNDVIRIARVESIDKDDRAVVFQPGSLQAGDLNAAFEQLLNGVQSISDSTNDVLKLDAGTQEYYDINSKRVINLASPTSENDAVTKGYVDDIVLAAGNLPDPTDGVDNSIIIISGGAWTIAEGGNIYLSRVNNLSDIASTSTARTNLGLGTAATGNIGTTSGDIPTLDGYNMIPSTLLPQASTTAICNIRYTVGTLGTRHGAATDEVWGTSYDPGDGATKYHKIKFLDADTVTYQDITYITPYDSTDADAWNASSIELASGKYKVRANLETTNNSSSSVVSSQSRLYLFDKDTGANGTQVTNSSNHNMAVNDGAGSYYYACNNIDTIIDIDSNKCMSIDLRNTLTTSDLNLVIGWLSIERINI